MKRSTLSSRKAGLIAIGLFYLLQTAYATFACGGNVLGMWVATTIALVPAFVAVALGSTAATIGACVGQLPFVLWANYVECVVPYTGGGAAMAYVVVFLFGMPISGLIALAVGWFAHVRAVRGRSHARREI